MGEKDIAIEETTKNELLFQDFGGEKKYMWAVWKTTLLNKYLYLFSISFVKSKGIQK